MAVFGKLLRPMFGVSDKYVAPFNEYESQAGLRLETVIRIVTKGCQLTLQNHNYDVLVPRLNEFDVELHGFVYEGVGVGLAALDSLFPWKNRTQDFLDGPGAAYIYALPLGTGMGLARLRRNPEHFLRRLDPVLGWLIIDGYGFHEGFFSKRKFIEQKKVPSSLSAQGRRVFDNGIGRAIWFLSGTRVEQVAATIASFPESRRADLWGGVGLACGYTGGVGREEIERLRTLAGKYRWYLAVGAALAANARHLVGNPSSYVKLACEVLCEIPTQEASTIVDEARQNLPMNGTEISYLIWRQRIASKLTEVSKSEEKNTIPMG